MTGAEKAGRRANPVVQRLRSPVPAQGANAMSRPRFLADHDLNEHIVAGVVRREPAIEFLRVRDVDLSRAADDVVLQFAQRQAWLVVSHDVNTMPAAAYARLALGHSLSGLFMVQQSLPIAASSTISFSSGLPRNSRIGRTKWSFFRYLDASIGHGAVVALEHQRAGG